MPRSLATGRGIFTAAWLDAITTIQTFLRLTLLAPDIVEALPNRRGGHFNVEALTKPLPATWTEQHLVLGI